MHLRLLHLGSLFLYSFIIYFLNDSLSLFFFFFFFLKVLTSANPFYHIDTQIIPSSPLSVDCGHSHFIVFCADRNSVFFRPVLWLSFWEYRASFHVFCFFSPCICCLLNSASSTFPDCPFDFSEEIHKPTSDKTLRFECLKVL